MFMEVILSVHGVVHGVGYRAFVKGIALRHSIKGNVRNVSDGSVEILAVGTPEALASFEDEIMVDTRHGPSVLHVEKRVRDEKFGTYADFEIEEDRQLWLYGALLIQHRHGHFVVLAERGCKLLHLFLVSVYYEYSL